MFDVLIAITEEYQVEDFVDNYNLTTYEDWFEEVKDEYDEDVSEEELRYNYLEYITKEAGESLIYFEVLPI